MRVEQDQGNGSPAGGRARSAATASAAVDDRRPHVPVGKHLLEDAAVGGVVVDDQHRQAAQLGGCAAARLVRRRLPRPNGA